MKSASTLSVSIKKKLGTRLKYHTFEELLTSEEVLLRLKYGVAVKKTPQKVYKIGKKTEKIKCQKDITSHEAEEKEKKVST